MTGTSAERWPENTSAGSFRVRDHSPRAGVGEFKGVMGTNLFWPPRRRCHSLHSNYMLNRGYAYTTIIHSKYPGQTLLSHLASLYPHSTPQAWQNKNGKD